MMHCAAVKMKVNYLEISDSFETLCFASELYILIWRGVNIGDFHNVPVQ